MFKLFFSFVMDTPVCIAALHTGVSENTAIQWYFWMREALTVAAWHDFNRIGKKLIEVFSSIRLFVYTTDFDDSTRNICRRLRRHSGTG